MCPTLIWPGLRAATRDLVFLRGWVVGRLSGEACQPRLQVVGDDQRAAARLADAEATNPDFFVDVASHQASEFRHILK